MLKELQTAVVDRLTDPSLTGSVRVMAWPSDPRNEIGRARTSGLLLVRYVRDTSEAPETINRTPLIQTGLASFELRLFYKGLRDHSEALPLMDQIRDLLSGYVPVLDNAENYSLGHQGFFQRDRGFMEMVEGIWDFFMIFQIPMTYRKRR